MNDKWLSRKLWIYIVLTVAGTVIWYLSETSVFLDWVTFVKWSFGIYAAGNGIEHGAKAMKKINGNG